MWYNKDAQGSVMCFGCIAVAFALTVHFAFVLHNFVRPFIFLRENTMSVLPAPFMFAMREILGASTNTQQEQTWLKPPT